MSIRKRLFISNAVMVLLPVVLFVLLFLFLNIVFSGDIRHISNNYRQGWQVPEAGPNMQVFKRLKKMSSLSPEQFLDKAAMDLLTKGLDKENTGIIIRKGNGVLYQSSYAKTINITGLPIFGNEGVTPVTWLGNRQYTVRQHDFYYDDGTEGSVFLLQEGVQFIQFARSYFPLIFFGLVLIVVLTNVVLSYLMARKILRPVNQLAAAAARISKGDLDFRIEPIGRDELGRLMKSFDDMRARLKESSEMRQLYENNRKELIANISHDLKTPITSIRGYVEGIKDGVANTEEKLERYLNTIQVKAAHMDHLIDELFLYSKLDIKSLPFHFEEVDLNAFIKDYLEELQLELNEKKVQVSLQAGQDLAAYIDREKLIRVMNNMIQNSVKYNDKKVCQIEISLQDEGDRVKVGIRDNGPGVSPSELPSIFNRFYRVDPSRNSHTGGSGLGLAIARQIIEAHGGKVWAESRPDEGLQIYFTLHKRIEKGDDL